jgi:hypothetical protein
MMYNKTKLSTHERISTLDFILCRYTFIRSIKTCIDKNKKSCHLSFNKHSVSFVKVIHFPYMHSYASYLKSIHYQWFVNASWEKPGSITVDDGISIQHQVPDCAPPTSPVTAFKWILWEWWNLVLMEPDDLHVLLNHDLHSNIINYYGYSRLAFAHV